MRLDFWQFTQGPIERIVALIAERAMAQGDRLLVVDGDEERRAATSRVLWEAKPEAFLAHGNDEDHSPERQPILLSDKVEPVNGARFAILADGLWRDQAIDFDRTILLFDEAGAAPARTVWRQFDEREDVVRGYFAQEGGSWKKKL